MNLPHAHLAVRRNSTTEHIVTNVIGWYSGMSLTTECGVKHADVREEIVTRETVPVTACKRCVKALGWDLTRTGRPLRTYGVMVSIPPEWPCSASGNGNRQRTVIVSTTSAARALEAFDAVLGRPGAVTASHLRTYGYSDMKGEAAEVSQPHPGVVFYDPADGGRTGYVPAPGQALSAPKIDPLTSLSHSVSNHAQGADKALLKGDLVMADGHVGMLLQQARELQNLITQTRQKENQS